MTNLSIITINYNNATGLATTIASVAAQQCEQLEYIVIDGGSTDDSCSIIKSYEAGIHYWVTEPDGGIYNAMNKGIEKATGDYLLFLNSGDALAHSNIVAELLPLLSGEDYIYGNLIKGFGKEATYLSYPDILREDYFYINALPHPASFIRRSLFQQLGGYNEQHKIISDWAFSFVAIEKHKCSYKHIPLFVSIFDTAGISSNNNSMKLVFEEKQQVIENHFPDRETAYLLHLKNAVSFRNILINKIRLILRQIFNVRKITIR